jgi:flagellar biosynthesis/type III secretory pathway protein FliH
VDFDINMLIDPKHGITLKNVLEIGAGVVMFLSAWTGLVFKFGKSKPSRTSKNELALLELALQDSREEKAALEKRLTEDCELKRSNSYREGYQHGEKAGHDKGYEAGKVDASGNMREEYADFLIAEAMRVKGEVETAEKSAPER